MSEGDRGWPLTRIHAFRAIRTSNVQQRIGDSQNARSRETILVYQIRNSQDGRALHVRTSSSDYPPSPIPYPLLS
jgi:hypothetical protein